MNTMKPTANNTLKIATIVSQIPQLDNPSHIHRIKSLEKIIVHLGKTADIILLPAGFFHHSEKSADSLYKEVETLIQQYINEHNLSVAVCLGIDGEHNKDQTALAINKYGIISVGRKFYPTDAEAKYVHLADNYLTDENKYSRIFELDGKQFYLGICYDCFGIRKKKLDNPNVDAILNLIHGFYPQGHGWSGEAYFAKYGLAGSSKQWNCPTFSSGVFFNRAIPHKWPTGVLWNQGDKSVQKWKYTDNAIESLSETEILCGTETFLARLFDI